MPPLKFGKLTPVKKVSRNANINADRYQREPRTPSLAPFFCAHITDTSQQIPAHMHPLFSVWAVDIKYGRAIVPAYTT